MYRRLHEIVWIVLIIGFINMYEILKNINISLNDTININEKNIKLLLIITIFFFLIFYNYKINIKTNMEKELILGLGLLGLIFIVISNDIILLYLSIELYSITVYLLLYKEKTSYIKISIIYFLIGSISSSIILYGISLIYLNTGVLDLNMILENLKEFIQYHDNYNENNYIGLKEGVNMIIIGILFKLGVAPFQYWVIRVYTHLDINILKYQSILPKFVYIIFLMKFINLGQITNNNKILLLSGILSLIIGSIGGLIHNNMKTLIGYSSIYNIGFVLLGVACESTFPFLNILQYLFIYSINTFHLLLALMLLKTKKKELNILSLSILISIFSLIGLPPFAGFFAKLNILLNLYYSENPLFFMSIFIILITTLIASIFYLKFINSLYFTIFKKPSFMTTDNYINKEKTIEFEGFDLSISYGFGFTILFSFFTLFLILYPLYLSYLTPFFESFSIL